MYILCTDLMTQQKMVILLLCLIVVISYIAIPPLKLPSASSMTDIATKDLSHLGTYDHTTKVSTQRWIYSIEAMLYKKGFTDSYLDLFLSWNTKDNYDKNHFIEDGIQEAHTQFLHDLDEAREKNEEVRFNVSQDYDWHNFPLSFYSNEYINPKTLVLEIETLLGGD